MKSSENIGVRLLVALIMLFITPLVIMLLWNWLMPVLFVTEIVGQIGYWQSMGLFILCNILFKTQSGK